MNALIEELQAIAEPFTYIPTAKRIVAACESRDWSAITRAANDAIADPKFMKPAGRADDILAWSKKANRLTLTARKAA